MRLGGRAAAAIEILEDIRRQHRPAARTLQDWGDSHRFAGSGDRSAIGNLVYDSLRKLASQAWRMEDDRAAAIVYATLFGQWGYAPERIDEIFRDDRFAPAPLSARALQSWRSRQIEEAPEHVQADIAQWCAEHFHSAFGADWVREGVALAERPPFDLRVNSLKSDRDRVLRRLARHGARPVDCAAHAIRIPPGKGESRQPNLQAEPGYLRGEFEIQDAGSQMAAALAGVRAGEQVLDFCAGAGGKTLAMSAAMENKGQIHAYDSDAARLAPIYQRVKRAGAHNIQIHRPHADLSSLAGRMDCVLVDAPCTGSGTWRRRPDAKWRLSESSLARRLAEQKEILAQAARYVREGGRLIYVTCSVFPAENCHQIGDFLRQNREFASMPLPAEQTAMCKSAYFPAEDGSMMLISPARTGTDGFFIAGLTRTS